MIGSFRGLTSLSMHPWLVRLSCSGIMMSSKSRIICSACMHATTACQKTAEYATMQGMKPW